VLVFDEPLNGLDPDGIRWPRSLLRDLAAQDRTVFVSSHLLTQVAQTVDDVVVLSHGRLVAQTTLSDLVAGSSVVRARTPDTVRLLEVLTLPAHGMHHLPAGIGQLYLGTVISSACFGMIGVTLGALTRNTIDAIVAAIAWTLFIEQVILHAIVPGIEKWLPTGVAVGLANAQGAVHVLPPTMAGLVLAGYAIALLVAASRTTMRRDLA
jgi:hypothetical protein